jgi:excisionase family DNA binding protein
MPVEPHLTALELAAQLKVSTDFIYRAVARGDLRGVRLGGSRGRGSGILRFSESDIENFLSSQRKASA